MQNRIITFGIFSVLFVIFLFLTYQVYMGYAFALDAATAQTLYAERGDKLYKAASVITWLGSGKFLLPAVILMASIFLFINGRRNYAWKVVLLSLSGYGMVYLIKHLVQRERPGYAGDDSSVYSYPSGHTFTGMMFFGLLVYFAIRYSRGTLRWIVIILAALITFAVGASRIFLDVHYATDVLASWILGTMWFILAGWFLKMKWKSNTKFENSKDEK